MPMFHNTRPISYWFSIAIVSLTIFPLVLPAQKTPKGSSSKKIDDSNRQMRLRFRLQTNPHDKQAHEDLIKILSAKYAFRQEMEEDGSWLRNNPDDYEAEIQMRSLATAAVNDPEYAINMDHFVLSHANRSDDPKDYDFMNDRLGDVDRQATQGIREDLERVAFALEPLDHSMSPKRRVFDGPVHKHDSRLS